MGCDMSQFGDNRNEDEMREQALKQWESEQDRGEGLDRQTVVQSAPGKDVGGKVAKGLFLALVGGALIFNFTRPDADEVKKIKFEKNQAKQEEPSSTEVPATAETSSRTAVATAETPAAHESSDKPALSPEEQARLEHQQAEAEEKRKKAEAMRLARLKSEIIVRPSNEGGNAAAAANKGGDGTGNLLHVSAAQDEGEAEAQAQPKQKSLQYGYDRNMRFMEETKGRDEVAYARHLGKLDYVALEGKFLDATLETQVTSTLPGKARAILSEPLFSERGLEILPRGTRLIGIYNTSIRKGQDLIFMAWRRAIRPDGIEVMLDSVGTNALGRAGMSGEVNNHYVQIFGTAAMLSIIGAGASMNGKGSESYGSAAEYRRAVTESFANQATNIMQPYAAIEPTINVHQGEIVKIFLQRDIDFTAVLAPKTPKKGQGALLLP